MYKSTKQIQLAVLVLLSVLCSNCGPSYYLVTSELSYKARPELEPEIIRSQSGLPATSRVAIKWPSNCDLTPPTSVHPARAYGCGLDVNELEKALMLSGFEVVGWDSLLAQAKVHSKTPEEVALALNIPILLRVNLSAPDSALLRGRWSREYHSSNARGDRGPTTRLRSARADQFDEFATAKENEVAAALSPFLTVDVTASSAVTSENVWSYRFTHATGLPKGVDLTILVRCDDDGCTTRQPGASARRPQMRSDSERDISLGDEALERERIKVLREIGADLAKRMREAMPPPVIQS